MRLTLLFLLVSTGTAMNASPHAFVEQQPDGTNVILKVKGDKMRHVMTDEQGFSVTRKANNWLVYTQQRQDKHYPGKTVVLPTELIVGKDDPVLLELEKGITGPVLHKENISKSNGITLRKDFRKQLRSASQEALLNNKRNKPVTKGKVKNLVILIKFSDHGSRSVPSKSDYEVLFNSRGTDQKLAPTGSVKKYFKDVSYGKLDIESEVYGWIDLPNSESYYNNHLAEAFTRALDEVDDKLNLWDFDSNSDGKIDTVTFLHTGYGAEWGATDCHGQPGEKRIWSHQGYVNWRGKKSGISLSDYHVTSGLWGTCGSDIARIGVIIHEFGHSLGLPDLYDGSGGVGIGNFDVMSNCWGFDGSQLHPPVMSAWVKMELGWLKPKTISQSDTYTIDAAINSDTVYKIKKNFPSGEYLLIENRQATSFDQKIPMGGLAIWHIDEKADLGSEGHPGQGGWPENGAHYKVALLQADGSYDLEQSNNAGDAGDLWHAYGETSLKPSSDSSRKYPNTDSYQQGRIEHTGIQITDISTSGMTMSFKLSFS